MALDIETLWQLERVGNVSLAPDSSAAVCTVTSYSMDQNKGTASLWLLPCNGGEPRRLTTQGEKDGNPAWSPRGDRIAFLAKREWNGKKDSERQLYVIPAHGGEAERKSDFPLGIDDFKWMPDGKRIAFISWVWPDVKGAKAQAKRHKEFTERKESAYVTSEAQYRFFDRGLPMGRVPHLLVLDVESGRVTDLFEGSAHELPRAEPGAAHFDISPDGRRIAFAHDPLPRKISTNPQAIAEIEVRSRRVTPLTRDTQWHYDAPRYSPDGSAVVCLAANVGLRHTMPNRLAILRNGKRPRIAGNEWKIDPEGTLCWSPGGDAIYFAAQEKGRNHLWRYDIARQELTLAVRGGWIQGFDVAGMKDDELVAVAIDSASHPVQVHAIRGGRARRLEKFNDERMAKVRLGETREARVRGAQGDAIQVFLTFPPRFDPARKHPILLVIHGGPYAASGDTFGFRWNTHVFASRGYVVVAVNYHGSSGFGFPFRDSIMGRQGQLETRDIEAATDWVLRQRWADRRRVFASGGSYGGFLVAWMNGHITKGRYRAYICHAGVFDRFATFSADSFVERPRDLGALYWENPEKVRSQSPHTFAHRMETPTLVIHGTNDYRVPDTNGLAYYNTLIARGVNARLVWFPDEHHWVMKPRNSRLWYREFFDWLAANDLKPARRS
jgi:dipeptidyl aminopeptidase/acylaminoacyl peptidase